MTAKWAISVFRFRKMPFLSSFWTWLHLGASTISYFIQVLLLKIISKFLLFMASMYLAVVQTGHHCYFWDFLNLHSVPFLFCSFFVLIQFFDFQRVLERKLYSPFEPQTRHSLPLLWQFKDNLLAREEFIQESAPELQLSTVCSSSLWNTNALVWAWHSQLGFLQRALLSTHST